MKSGFQKLELFTFQDYRGQLKKPAMKSKLDEGQEIQEVYVLYSSKGTVRGNHYHKETIEFFTVLSGEAKMAFSDIDKNNIDIITVKAEDNITIKVHPNTIHSIKNEGTEPLIVLAVSLREYNPKDTDTFTCNILE